MELEESRGAEGAKTFIKAKGKRKGISDPRSIFKRGKMTPRARRASFTKVKNLGLRA